MILSAVAVAWTFMKRNPVAYVISVMLAALIAAGILASVEPIVPAGAPQAVFLLCALACVAELMSVVLSSSLSGSVAFIPYLAAVLISPNWVALAGVTAVRLLFERRREAAKAWFNVSAHALTFAVTALFYRATGGKPLLGLHGVTLLEATKQVGLQSLLAFYFSFAVNWLLVSRFISMASNQPMVRVVRESQRSTVGVDFLAAPVVFIFAWVYVSFGAIAAACVWVPILGLRQIQKANVALERTNQELLELMVKSIEARDPYTSGHSRRVHHYSVAIARALGLPGKAIERIGQAALLHDVGKIHEKYAPILRNPNRLTPDEWLVMKEHPVDGAVLISTVSGLRDLMAPVRSHHENWDGTGYPDGIAGETIPLESRVIMFADTIDAMTSERPYRPSLGSEQVRAEIVRARGRQFDPELTDRILAANVWSVLFPDKNAAKLASAQGLRLERADRKTAPA